MSSQTGSFLWGKTEEVEFFTSNLKNPGPDKLFYKIGNQYVSYSPKGNKQKVEGDMNSRNGYVGDFTELWAQALLEPFATQNGLYALRKAVCEDVGLTTSSPADIAFCKDNSNRPEARQIKLIIEVKMSIVWNWKFENGELACLGDYTKHSGVPSILRSDSVLKAIGKSAIIRTSGLLGTKIPIIVLGNTPIGQSYYGKVDFLKKSGLLQGVWSVNPSPLDNAPTLKNTADNGFVRMDSNTELGKHISGLLNQPQEFFSGMLTLQQLGKIIELANQKNNTEQIAEEFLSLIRV